MAPLRGALAAAAVPLLLLLAAPRARAIHHEPPLEAELEVFRMLSYSGLNGAVNIGDDFGAEDKLVLCYNRSTVRSAGSGILVYPDLDNVNGTLFVSVDEGSGVGVSWSTIPITSIACPDPNQPPSPLAPRDSGYTVGITLDNSTGFDRILILGGDGDETNNVYYSDDCGATFFCYDGEQEWDPRDFSPIWRNPWDPATTWMGGGFVGGLFSVGVWNSGGSGGIYWQRPNCTNTSLCANSDVFPPPNGTAKWLLPTEPALAGQITSDWATTYLFDSQSGFPVWQLNQANESIGFQQVPNSVTDGFGRKVFVRGTAPGSGCFVSTDFTAVNIYFPEANPYMSNMVKVASTAAGPWDDIEGPWRQRIASAVIAAPDNKGVIVASGMELDESGQPAYPINDIWLITNNICMLNSNQLICGGPTQGTPDMLTLKCSCLPGFAGRACDVIPSVSASPSISTSASASNSIGYTFSSTATGTATASGTATGTGTASVSTFETASSTPTPTATATGTATASVTSSSSASATTGASDSPTATGSATGTSTVTASPTGTSTRTGTPTRSNSPQPPTPSRTPSSSPAAPQAAPPGLDPGVATRLGVGAVLVSLGAGVFVWARFLGGGPSLSAFANRVASGAGGGGGGRPTDRVGLLRPSASASFSRVASLGSPGQGGGGGGGGYGASASSVGGGGADNPFGRR